MHMFLPPLVFGRLDLRTLWGKCLWLLYHLEAGSYCVVLEWLFSLVLANKAEKEQVCTYMQGTFIPSNEVPPFLPPLVLQL